MKKSNGTPRVTRNSFFKNAADEKKVDDVTFKAWKNELEKELPSFWESMKNL